VYTMCMRCIFSSESDKPQWSQFCTHSFIHQVYLVYSKYFKFKRKWKCTKNRSQIIIKHFWWIKIVIVIFIFIFTFILNKYMLCCVVYKIKIMEVTVAYRKGLCIYLILFFIVEIYIYSAQAITNKKNCI